MRSLRSALMMLTIVVLALPGNAHAQWFRPGSYLPTGYSPLHYWAPNLYRWHMMHHGPRIPMHAAPTPASSPMIYSSVPVRTAEPLGNPTPTLEPAPIAPVDQ